MAKCFSGLASVLIVISLGAGATALGQDFGKGQHRSGKEMSVEEALKIYKALFWENFPNGMSCRLSWDIGFGHISNPGAASLASDIFEAREEQLIRQKFQPKPISDENKAAMMRIYSFELIDSCVAQGKAARNKKDKDKGKGKGSKGKAQKDQQAPQPEKESKGLLEKIFDWF